MVISENAENTGNTSNTENPTGAKKQIIVKAKKGASSEEKENFEKAVEHLEGLGYKVVKTIILTNTKVLAVPEGKGEISTNSVDNAAGELEKVSPSWNDFMHVEEDSVVTAQVS